MSGRVVVAGLFHETNTFLAELTDAPQFSIRRGAELLQSEGDSSPLSAALQMAAQYAWDVVPVIDVRAMPSGLAADSAVDEFWGALSTVLSSEPYGAIDGIYLVLHGAMVSQSLLDVEGEMLRRIRELPGMDTIPICGVLDLHANATAAMAAYSTAMVAYRENPHTDAAEAAVRGAALLERIMRTRERPVTLWARAPIVWPPTGVATADEPMRALEARARAIEASCPDVLAVNVFAGFPFADTPDTGVSFTAATVGDVETASRFLDELVELAWTMRAVGNRLDMPVEEALRRVRSSGSGPNLLVEPADNIGGGSPGDTTGLLRCLIEADVRNAAVILNDPQTVAGLGSTRIGATVRAALGGKSGVPGAIPVELDVTLVSRGDGEFEIEDPHSHLASISGSFIDMGQCAVVRHRGILILLTSRKTPPFDLGQWRSQGIEPERLRIIGVKAAVAHRQAYDPIAKTSYSVATPGPCASDLRTLPFKHIRRPVYPLDD